MNERRYTMADVAAFSEQAVARAMTGQALDLPAGGTHPALPQGFATESDSTDEKTVITQDGGAITQDSIGLQRLLSTVFARSSFTYKTGVAGRSADFFIASPALGLDLQPNGVIARCELWALQGAVRSLVSVGSTRGMGDPIDNPTAPSASNIGHWICSGRVAVPCQWELVLYFRLSALFPPTDPSPTNITLVTDPRWLPQAPPSVGSVPWHSTLSFIRLPSGLVANPTLTATELHGGLAPPRLISLRGMNLTTGAGAIPLFLQVSNTITQPGPTIPQTRPEIEVALNPGQGMVGLGPRELEAMDLRGNSGGNMTITVSKVSNSAAVADLAASGSAWWQAIWK